MATGTDQPPPFTQPSLESRKRPRVGLLLAVVCGLAIAYFVGLGVGRSNASVQAQPVAQPGPVVTTRTVTVPGPTVTVPGPTVTVPGPTVTVPGPTVTVGAPVSGSSPTASSTGSTFSTGTYEVGTEIQPGTYRTSGSDWCYWERLSSNDGEFDSIITNGNANGPSSLSVKASDAFVRFSGTCSWTRR